MKSLHMPKELNDLSDRVLNGLKWHSFVTLVPNGEELPRKCKQIDGAMKDAWEGLGPSERIFNLAQGHFL